ncbi:MAG TPA: alpha/beta hydrolase-fold protein [Vicinamibacterales bacterium]|nr:alpha/beta hydrolase-fold protein [Vicinamibacterales bacterium]
MKTTLSAACVGALVLAGALLQAQGRGGRAGGAPGVPAAAGSVERITVHGKALEGNLEADSPDREVTVYLPPSYNSDQKRRFPVVYLLHGYGGQDDTFTARLASLQESGDRMAAAQGFSEQIVVTPNAFTLHKGSMYSASPTIGDWERFIAEDLVAYIDSHYRTLPARVSRGLAGHSMGGYGALRIGMKRPDVFMSLYLMSSCCLTANGDPNPKSMAEAEAIKTREQAEEAARGRGFGPSVLLASAAAWSPNPKNPPLFLDLPMRNGKPRPEVIAKWAANAPLEMLEQHAPALKQYYAVAMEIGTMDPLLRSNQQLHTVLTKLRIPHSYDEYDGDHTNKVRERIERNVLPFFSKNLVAPANPTSPLPQQK